MATTAQVYQLYLAYFGRPPDFTGLNSFANSSPAQVQAIFSASAESRALLGSTDTATQVNNIYQNLFGRDAETAGLAYWVNEIASGRVTLASAAFDILNGARNADATVVANRIEVAQAFVANYSATTAGILGYVGDAAAAQARTFLRTVTDTAASKTAALAGVAAAVTSTVAAGGTTTPVVGSTFTLTTGVDAPSGGAGNDTISGLLGSSGTYTVGDNIAGGSGTDSLNLIATTGTDGDGGLVSINSVETINVRLLTTAFAASAGDEVSLNAADWVGVTTITNASSLVNTRLDVSGLTDDTVVVLHGNTDISVGYNNTATGATANAVLVNAGSAGTATTIGSASATNTANFDFDEADAGLVTHVNLEVRGSLNLANIEAGSSVTNYTITGTGNAALITDDTITSFDASAAAGNIDITFSGASEVTAKGGAGNDTFRLGTTISNNDSVNGGAGNDTIAFTIGGFTRSLVTTSIETANITFADDNGGSVNATGAASVTTYNLGANSAGADGTVNDIVSGATINLGNSADAFGLVTLDGASGAQAISIVAGTASGAMAFDLTVTDVARVTLTNAVGTSTNAGTLTLATASFDEDAKQVTIQTSTGTGAIAITDLLTIGATAVTIASNGSGEITVGTGISGSALSVVSITTNGSADVTTEEIVGTGLTNITLDANAGGNIFLVGADAGSGIEIGNNSTGSTVAVVVLNLNAETNSDVGTAAANASGILVNSTGAMNLTVNMNAGSASGGVHLGIIDIDLGGASAETTGTVLNVSAGSIATNSIVRSETINVNAMTGTQVNVGAVTVGASATFILASGGIDATDVDNVDVSALSMTLAASAIVAVGAITTTGGMVNRITLSAVDGASATFGAIRASGVGAMSLTIGSGASANFGNIDVSASGAIASIEIAGSDAGGVTFGTMSASAVGSIAISGALDVTFGTITANRIGSINASNQGASGALTIDLSGVSAAAELSLGAAQNVVISGKGNDVITLKAGVTGNDQIRYSTALQGTDQIVNFGAGSTGGDQIDIAVAIGTGTIRDFDGSAVDAASIADLTVAVSGATTLGATDNVLILTTALANTAALVTFMTASITLGTAAIAGSGGMMVAWTDGSDTYISVISFESGAAAMATLASAANVTATTLAQITGVTPGALVAANFDFV